MKHDKRFNRAAILLIVAAAFTGGCSANSSVEKYKLNSSDISLGDQLRFEKTSLQDTPEEFVAPVQMQILDEVLVIDFVSCTKSQTSREMVISTLGSVGPSKYNEIMKLTSTTTGTEIAISRPRQGLLVGNWPWGPAVSEATSVATYTYPNEVGEKKMYRVLFDLPSGNKKLPTFVWVRGKIPNSNIRLINEVDAETGRVALISCH